MWLLSFLGPWGDAHFSARERLIWLASDPAQREWLLGVFVGLLPGDILEGMTIDPESLYLQLKQLVVEAPSMDAASAHADVCLWLGRAALLPL